MGLVPYNQLQRTNKDGIPYMRVNILPSGPYMRLTRATKDKEISPITFLVDPSRDLYMSSHLTCQCQCGQGMIKDQEMSYLQHTCQLSLCMTYAPCLRDL